MFKARDRRARGKCRICIERLAPRAQTKHRIMAQCLAVIAVLVARGDLEQALREDFAGRMYDIAWVAINQCRNQPCSQSDLPIHTPQQQRPQVGRQSSAGEIGADGKACGRRKTELGWGRIRHGQKAVWVVRAVGLVTATLSNTCSPSRPLYAQFRLKHSNVQGRGDVMRITQQLHR